MIERDNGARRRQSYGPNDPEATRKHTAVASYTPSARVAIFQKHERFDFSSRTEVTWPVAFQKRNQPAARFWSDTVSTHLALRGIAKHLANQFRHGWRVVGDCPVSSG